MEKILTSSSFRLRVDESVALKPLDPGGNRMKLVEPFSIQQINAEVQSSRRIPPLKTYLLTIHQLILALLFPSLSFR